MLQATHENTTTDKPEQGRHVFPVPAIILQEPPIKALPLWTVVISIGIHAFVLVGLFQATAGLNVDAPNSAVIEVDFVSPPVTEPEPEPTATPEQPTTPEPPQPPAPPPPPPPPPPQTEPPPPPPEVKPPQPVNKAKQATEVHHKAKREAAPVTITAPTPKLIHAVPTDGGLLPLRDDSLAAYSRLVWARIERRKPRDIHAPGVATVTFAIDTDGSLLSATISGSSGIDSLDRAAISAVASSAPFPQPPPGTTSAQRVFSIPFEFR